MRVLPVLAVLSGLLAGCGEKLPPRYVIETDLGDHRFRRYQQVLDIELPVEGNPAVGHTAAYVRGGANVAITPVLVTVYEHGAGLADNVRARLRGMSGYTFDVVEVAGEHVWRMRGESGDVWMLWTSGRHLPKVGAPEGTSEVPREVVEAYLERYPSDLNARGQAEPGRESAGTAPSPAPESQP